MAHQFRNDSRPSTESTTCFQRLSSDYTDTQNEQESRDSLPKYYPKEHEVTRWLVNQMRCRNGLHHLVNLANVQPSLLSAYFEIYDQPHLYIDARTGPGMPAYGIKTVLYLTPLAIAIYLRLRSVLRLLLDSSGTRIHARARQEVEVNATCYVRRTKPRPGPFVMDEYSTTHPAVLAVRREFFTGLTLLMSAGFRPQEPIRIIERLGTTRETTHCFVDILDFCVKLLNTRPGVDVIGLLQTISYRTLTDAPNSGACNYDPCVYDVRPSLTDNCNTIPSGEVWCSVFHRLARKGASRSYSNCGNRLIGLLEHIAASGFFRQKFVTKGPVNYDPELVGRKGARPQGSRKMTPEMINQLSGAEKEAALLGIAADRDSCLCLLTLWLERVRNRCLVRQAQRLFRLLTTALYDTDLLQDFLFPPPNIDQNHVIHPYWLAIGLSKIVTKQLSASQTMAPVDFLEDDGNEICELEPPQINEIRQEVGILGHALGLVDYSENLYKLGCPRMMEVMPVSGAIGDAEYYTHNPSSVLPTRGIKEGAMSHNDTEPMENRCLSEESERRGGGGGSGQSRSSFGVNIIPGTAQKRNGVSNNRVYWSSPSRNVSLSPPLAPNKSVNLQAIQIENTNDNRNNTVLEEAKERGKVAEATAVPEVPVEKTTESPDPSEHKPCSRPTVTKNKKMEKKKSSTPTELHVPSKPSTRASVWRTIRAEKNKAKQSA